tara:strand:- start:94 stop:444 length:351 start_codon:yes stop_codon:yes gene_type:complete
MAKKVLILNNNVVDVADTAFEVHSSLTWMDCSDDSVNTRWTLVDGVLTPPSNEITSQDWDKFRSSRNKKLQQSDWTQSRDVSLSNDNEWKTYRQALRDLPTSTTDPRSPSWPTKPS